MLSKLRLMTAMAFAAGSAPAFGFQVFACEPEWAALTRTLHPNAVITTATHAGQDPHHIEARPSLVAALRRADLAVCTGASLEIGWLPMLQSRAANPAVRDGANGMFYAAQHTKLRDAGRSADRTQGDVHPEGNPHVHLDPGRVPEIARALAERLVILDSSNAAPIRQRLAAFESDWQQHTQRWMQARERLSGRGVVVQHTAFSYLLAFLGLREIADLEPLPGLPPTMTHLQQVLAKVRTDPPMAIMQTRYQSPQPGQWLSERLGLPLLTLPSTVTDDAAVDELAELLDTLIARLAEQVAQ